MRLSLLTPEAGLVGLAGAVALAVLVRGERRSRRVATLLGLPARRGAAGVAPAAALALVATLLGLAAAQPVLSTVRPLEGRTDAEVVVVFDVTRSMLARDRGRPSRLARARSLAKLVRAGIPDVPVGVSSLSDRVLPYLFPTTSVNAFTATVDRAVGIERPPPDRSGRGRATNLGALGALGSQNFYTAAARRRVAVVLSDAETLPFDVGGLRNRLAAEDVRVVLVHVWGPDERVWAPDGAVERYRPDADTPAAVRAIARAIRARALGESDPDAIVAAVRAAVGEGPTGPRGRELRAVELAPHAALAAFAPLLFLLWRRNF